MPEYAWTILCLYLSFSECGMIDSETY